ncbi:MAG: tRNA pseudouridine(13) synthase TruD, partial [Thermoplasmata archaeon]|nr:tRNA pseudouridine(13) synthase TruD [Thermoplasmata archaeon]
PQKALAPAQPPIEGAPPKYTLVKIRAINWETNNLIREISRRLRIPRQHIYFAGTKDKRAITTQTMALKTSAANLENVEIKGVEFFDITTANNPLKMGDLLGNRFNIKISDIELEVEALKSALEQTAQQLEHLNGFTNFFGVQRFGAVRPITHLFGKYLVNDDLESAVFTYLGNPMEGESPEAYDARAFIEKTHDFEEALKLFPKHLGFERTLIQYLIRQPTNYAGAIKRLPKNLQIMFIHAYQSYLFNKILSERVRRQLPLHEPVLGDFVLTVDKNGLPDHDNWIMVTEANQPKLTKRVAEGKAFISGVLFGAESEYAGSEPGEIERGVIEAEELGQRDFIIP